MTGRRIFEESPDVFAFKNEPYAGYFLLEDEYIQPRRRRLSR
jgi:hypothetical protein